MGFMKNLLNAKINADIADRLKETIAEKDAEIAHYKATVTELRREWLVLDAMIDNRNKLRDGKKKWTAAEASIDKIIRENATKVI